MSTAAPAGSGIRTGLRDGLLARDSWSRDRLLAFQRERLRDLLRHARASSPYYREVLGQGAEDAELSDLPTLPKATLMEQFDRVAVDPRLRLVSVEAHAAGDDPGGLLAGAYHVFATSGTTGRRGIFPQTAAEFGVWLAAAGRMLARLGVDPSTRVIGIGAPTPLHITRKLFGALGGVGAGRPELTITAPLSELVKALNRDRPGALLTVPSLAGILAEEQLEGRLAIRPHRLVVAGEVLSSRASRAVAEAWAIEPFQVYASTEALILASDSPDRVGLHISEDLVVLEVVDEQDRPVPPGVPGFKVLLTSLVNQALPLIRYELADSVTIAPGVDPSGRPYQRIERVDGRNDDVLWLPSPGGGEVIVLPYRLRAPFTHLSDVLEYQLVHEERRLFVRVLLRPGASPETPSRIAAAVRAALEAAGAIPPPIAVKPVAALEREPGGAKLKLVKSARRPPPPI